MFITSLVTYSVEYYVGRVNIGISVIAIFSFMVSLTNVVLMKPSISNNGNELSAHSRFLLFILGVWAIVVPFIELVWFKSFLISNMTNMTFSLARLF
jgi:uncharacterized protein YhhL (DUF1145 family)